MERRGFLQGASVVIAGIVAGCSGNSAEDNPAPSSKQTTDAAGSQGTRVVPSQTVSPSEVLPAAPKNWERTSTREVGQGVNAESGIVGLYTSDSSKRYRVGIYKFESQDRVDEIVAQIEDRGEFYEYSVAVKNGVFLCTGGTSDGQLTSLISLMSGIQGLNEEYIQSNNLISPSTSDKTTRTETGKEGVTGEVSFGETANERIKVLNREYKPGGEKARSKVVGRIKNVSNSRLSQVDVSVSFRDAEDVQIADGEDSLEGILSGDIRDYSVECPIRNPDREIAQYNMHITIE